MAISIIILVVLLIPILAIVLDSNLGRALAQRLERRGIEAGSDVTSERLAFLESELERLSSEVLRLDEEGQFLQKLLTDKVDGDAPPAALPKGDPDA